MIDSDELDLSSPVQYQHEDEDSALSNTDDTESQSDDFDLTLSFIDTLSPATRPHVRSPSLIALIGSGAVSPVHGKSAVSLPASNGNNHSHDADDDSGQSDAPFLLPSPSHRHRSRRLASPTARRSFGLSMGLNIEDAVSGRTNTNRLDHRTRDDDDNNNNDEEKQSQFTDTDEAADHDTDTDNGVEDIELEDDENASGGEYRFQSSLMRMKSLSGRHTRPSAVASTSRFATTEESKSSEPPGIDADVEESTMPAFHESDTAAAGEEKEEAKADKTFQTQRDATIGAAVQRTPSPAPTPVPVVTTISSKSSPASAQSPVITNVPKSVERAAAKPQIVRATAAAVANGASNSQSPSKPSVSVTHGAVTPVASATTAANPFDLDDVEAESATGTLSAPVSPNTQPPRPSQFQPPSPVKSVASSIPFTTTSTAATASAPVMVSVAVTVTPADKTQPVSPPLSQPSSPRSTIATPIAAAATATVTASLSPPSSPRASTTDATSAVNLSRLQGKFLTLTEQILSLLKHRSNEPLGERVEAAAAALARCLRHFDATKTLNDSETDTNKPVRTPSRRSLMFVSSLTFLSTSTLTPVPLPSDTSLASAPRLDIVKAFQSLALKPTHRSDRQWLIAELLLGLYQVVSEAEQSNDQQHLAAVFGVVSELITRLTKAHPGVAIEQHRAFTVPFVTSWSYLPSPLELPTFTRPLNSTLSPAQFLLYELMDARAAVFQLIVSLVLRQCQSLPSVLESYDGDEDSECQWLEPHLSAISEADQLCRNAHWTAFERSQLLASTLFAVMSPILAATINAEQLSMTDGIKLKVLASNIQQFAQRLAGDAGLEAAEACGLATIRELALLLLLDKSSVDLSMVRAMAPHLDLMTVHRALFTFLQTEGNEEVSAELIPAIAQAMSRMSEDEQTSSHSNLPADGQCLLLIDWHRADDRMVVQKPARSQELAALALQHREMHCPLTDEE